MTGKRDTFILAFASVAGVLWHGAAAGPVLAGSAVVTRSAKTCSELQWEFYSGNTAVCGRSNFRNTGCFAKLQYEYDDAAATCESVGARVCTLAEVQTQAVRASGCQLDNQLIWTSTPCPSGQNGGKGATVTATTVSAAATADSNVFSGSGSPDPFAGFIDPYGNILPEFRIFDTPPEDAVCTDAASEDECMFYRGMKVGKCRWKAVLSLCFDSGQTTSTTVPTSVDDHWPICLQAVKRNHPQKASFHFCTNVEPFNLYCRWMEANGDEFNCVPNNYESTTTTTSATSTTTTTTIPDDEGPCPPDTNEQCSEYGSFGFCDTDSSFRPYME
eukprot:gene21576-24232_t